MWLSMFQVNSNLDPKMAYTNRVSDTAADYKLLSFIAQMELGRLVGSTVGKQRTAYCGQTLGVCVCFILFCDCAYYFVPLYLSWSRK
jgi:hypothetical protein